MGAAHYVGRIGGLAVALGVGSAVFTGQGVAWADATGDSASQPSSSETSESTSTATSPSTSEATDSSTDETDADKESSDAEEVSSDADEEVDEELDTEADEDTDDPVEAEVETSAEGPEAEEPAAESKHESSSATTIEDAHEPEAAPTVEADETVDAADDPELVEKVSEPSDTPARTRTAAMSAKASTTTTMTPTLSEPEATPKKYTLATAVVNVVNSMIDWAHQKADKNPGSEPQPPFLWALMSFARRELETLFAVRTASAVARSSAAITTSLALTEDTTNITTLATNSPFLNPQLSASTKFVSWVTGNHVYLDKTKANTVDRFQVYGTDVGTMWDNGMVDDPDTPENEHQVLIAVGDTFGGPNMTGRHIYNTLFRSSDDDLSDGITIPNGEWFNGNMFGGAPLDAPTRARPIINRPSWLPGSVTLIPTAGISVPTEVTEDTPFGTIQYVSFMSVKRWGAAGRWSTNYSAIAYSTDNGENFTVARGSVRNNSFFGGNKNFQQSAFVEGDDGYIYMYGTPNGRQGAAYLARVAPEDILNTSKYEYYKAARTGWFGTTPASWQSSASSASAIIGKSGGFFGRFDPGYTVSEMSVQYNEYLQKYVVMYGDQFNNIVIRTADTPEGEWSDPTVLIKQQNGGIYAPMMHPWSPSTLGEGSDLYWNLSLWSDYNIMLMRTDLTKI